VVPRASYGGSVPVPSGGGVIASVDPRGPGAHAGLQAGDTIVSADGVALRDIIDWRWLTDGPSVTIEVQSPGSPARPTKLQRGPAETWGIEFSDALFDAVRTCRNDCTFCFVSQLPKGLRSALYVRDDDFRLSFLQGNFITLTNLTDADVERIVEQRLSPLFVSVHAVEPDVRHGLVCAHDDRALERLDELLSHDIEVHVQIVLVPGVNDAQHLDETLTWLAEREGVASVGVVPLGYTAHQVRFGGSYEGQSAERVVRQIERWQRAFRQRDDVSWVYLADEFYLKAGLDLPVAEEYDGYPQFENGIGIARSFIDEMASGAPRLRAAVAALPSTSGAVLMTGELAAPLLARAISEALGGQGDDRLEVLPVANRFLGGNVSVAGLLTAHDLVPALRAHSEDTVFLIPDIVANADGLLLDDVSAAELGTTSGRDVRLISCDAAGLLTALEELAAIPPTVRE
jgi:putative radical SAM enzyme (TIGR03279 family)